MKTDYLLSLRYIVKIFQILKSFVLRNDNCLTGLKFWERVFSILKEYHCPQVLLECYQPTLYETES